MDIIGINMFRTTPTFLLQFTSISAFPFSGHTYTNKNQDTCNIRSGTLGFTSPENYKCYTDVVLNHVCSVRNANLMKGKSDYSNTTV